MLEMQFADFISCAFDQIVNTAATLRYRHGGRASCPLVIRAPSGGGIHGALFHSQNPEAWFTRVPGLKVVAPATAYDAKGLLKSAIRDDNPVIYFEHKRLYRSVKEDLPEGEFTVPIGVAEVRKTGQDLSVITYGGTLHQAGIASMPHRTDRNERCLLQRARPLCGAMASQPHRRRTHRAR